jgi:hypothetical protein
LYETANNVYKNENLYETANNVYKTENLYETACFDNKKGIMKGKSAEKLWKNRRKFIYPNNLPGFLLCHTSQLSFFPRFFHPQVWKMYRVVILRSEADDQRSLE